MTKSKMHTQTEKVTISLPKSTYLEIEEKRREMGLERSALILRALLLWLGEIHQQELDAKYEQGYRKNPEKVAEREPLYRAGLESFTPEDW